MIGSLSRIAPLSTTRIRHFTTSVGVPFRAETAVNRRRRSGAGDSTGAVRSGEKIDANGEGGWGRYSVEPNDRILVEQVRRRSELDRDFEPGAVS